MDDCSVCTQWGRGVKTWLWWSQWEFCHSKYEVFTQSSRLLLRGWGMNTFWLSCASSAVTVKIFFMNFPSGNWFCYKSGWEMLKRQLQQCNFSILFFFLSFWLMGDTYSSCHAGAPHTLQSSQIDFTDCWMYTNIIYHMIETRQDIYTTWHRWVKNPLQLWQCGKL